jgi:hypothetical protein
LTYWLVFFEFAYPITKLLLVNGTSARAAAQGLVKISSANASNCQKFDSSARGQSLEEHTKADSLILIKQLLIKIRYRHNWHHACINNRKRNFSWIEEEAIMKVRIGNNLYVMELSNRAFAWFTGETERMRLTSLSLLFVQFSLFASRFGNHC